MKSVFQLFTAATLIFCLASSTARAEEQVFIDFDDPAVTEELRLSPDTTATVYVDDIVMPAYVYAMPLVFTHMQQLDTISPLQTTFSDNPSLRWADKEIYKINNIRRMRQNIFVNYPEYVRYNLNMLPEPPKQYIAVADPEKAILVIEEVHTEIDADSHEVPVEENKIHWLSNFTGNIQFSQAYNSPNWYQGGNSHLNLLVNANYNLKLNEAYHPNLLFELNIQYKLAVNSTPDDSLRKYNISEDLFQINSKFGLRASKHWFYTLNLMAKTQFFNNFETNTNNMTASFMSPGEINVGLGMTYTYANPKKTVEFTGTVSPASWNLRSCINKRMDPTQFDIKPGHKFTNQIGSSAEATLNWKIAYNIALKSRLFAFTDYDYIQGDWENTITFSINKYLTTMLFVHLRYDSSTPRNEYPDWHRWQLREILSFGFSYTFATV